LRETFPCLQITTADAAKAFAANGSRITTPKPSIDMQNYLDLTDKVALVTGASSGIGAATAEALAELGARVAISYHQNEPGAAQVRDSIESAGGRVIAVRADVRRAEEITSLVRRATGELGPIDILVNNAGSLIERQTILELTKERWDEVMNLNLTSAMLCSQAVAGSMIERKTGAIINVVSIAGRTGGGPGAGAYSVAKAGLIALTKSLAKELAPHGVRVNAISPGVIDTRFHEVFSTPEMMRNFVAAIPLGRVGTAVECAKVIAFLASDAASYVVGETIEVNGGQLML
jgi:NAD(P)-dependent dehydrogenase (short-subunit alcohol dehydrogenase family)